MGDRKIPLSKLGVLVAQLESIVASASLKPPDPLMCFDLLSDLLSTLEDEPKDSILACQRKCEDALQALLLLGARPPVRRLASKALVLIIERGDTISIYSRTSSLQGWLSDSRKVDASSYIGAARCLGAFYRSYGQKITSGLLETSNIVVKLIKFPEVGVRQAALQLFQDALEGLGGGGPSTAYSEALRAVLRVGATDRSPAVRATAAACMRAYAVTGGPGIGVGGLESCASLCVKSLEDHSQPVRDAFAAALGALLALGLNPEAQVQPRGKAPVTAAKTLEGGLSKHLIGPFMRASGPRCKDIRVGLTMAWVAFLQGMHLTYFHSDFELQNFAIQAMSMLTFNSKSTIDAHSQACVLYILRVGIVEQMSEPAQKEFITLLTQQLSLADTSSSMLVVILRTLSHLLVTLGEVSSSTREGLENSLVATLSNSSVAVRIETALTIRALAEVDSTCANSLMSCGVTTLRALREIVAIEKGDRLKLELDSLHGQAAMLASLLAANPRLLLGVPSRLHGAILEVAKRMVLEQGRNPFSIGAEKEAGWLLIAAIVPSMPKEEMQEQEFDIIALWTVPFGGNSEDRLRKAEDNLLAEVSGWSAAVEALTSFLKNYVVPNLSPEKEGILLQPILGYLSGALAYISSSTLQQVPNGLKQAVDLFTIRTLAAFQALPDPLAYKNDHNTLLKLCTNPFRDPSSWEESSSLRQLLDSRDASLGPWVPGRDSFEDELRAFEGGSDGPLPCVWENEISFFPQPLAVATLLVNHLLISFGMIFVVQTDSRKMQLLDIVEGSVKAGRKQPWHGSNITNICVSLLAALKMALQIRLMEYKPDIFKRVQLIFQAVLAEEVSSPAQCLAAAEGLGFLARLGNDVFAARLMRSLLTDAGGASDLKQKGSIAVALGCIQRSKGGMALSVLVPATVQTLCSMARDPKDYLHIWSLHGLWLTTDAAGLSYVPYVQTTMSLAMEILLSEEHAGPELQQGLGRLVNAIVAVIGPELSPGSSFFSRCKSVVSEISSGEEPAALLESVLFTQQLVLFAPQAVSVHTHVQTLKPMLSSRQPSLRQAAASTLRHLAERDPMSMVDERIEENLFAMLDTETDTGIVNLVRLILARLLEAACPSCPSRWLHLCRNVVLATSTTIAASSSFSGSEYDPGSPTDTRGNERPLGDDDEGMITRAAKAGQPGASISNSNVNEIKLKEGEQLPRYRTRLFAAECLSRLPTAVGADPRHFDLLLAKEHQNNMDGHATINDWLVLHLGELVALAYQVSTGTFESMRPKGVMLLVTILDKFGRTKDPDYLGHLLLEQYQAQLVSALRTALDPSSGPLLIDAGLQLAARMVTSDMANGDLGVLRRIFTLISRPLNDFEGIRYPSYAEWVGCKVQVSLLGAHAAVKTYAYSCLGETSEKAKEGQFLIPLVANHAAILGNRWIGLLKDYTLLRTYLPSQLQLKYIPFLDGLTSPAVALIVEPYLREVWPVVLEAVTLDMVPAKGANILSNDSGNEGNEALSKSEYLQPFGSGVAVSLTEYNQLWALCISILCDNKEQATHKFLSSSSFRVTSFRQKSYGRHSGLPESQLIALRSLRHLCNQGFYHPNMLSCSLLRELLKVLICLCVKSHLSAYAGVLPILEQVVNCSPDEYLENEDVVLSVVEHCIYCAHQLMNSAGTKADTSFLNSDIIIISILHIIEKLTFRLSAKRQNQLVPLLLCAGIKFMKAAPSTGNALAAVVGFVSSLASSLGKLSTETGSEGESGASQLASLSTAVVESLAHICEQIISISSREGEIEENMEELTFKLPKLLGSMVAVARNVPDFGLTNSEEGLRWTSKDMAIKRCIKCLHGVLTNSNILVQSAGLQTLRTLTQKSITEQNKGENNDMAILMMRELGADVILLVYNSMKICLTAISAAAVGESLKLILLLYSLVEGVDAQQEVLHLLLPAIVAAAFPAADVDSQFATGLRSVAVKLVIHLATVPESTVQFRTVLLEMPIELRQKLQEIIRASIEQQGSSLTVPTPQVPTAAQRLVVPLMSSSKKPSLESHTDSLSGPPISSKSMMQSPISVSQNQIEEEGEDDDWDDFQSHPISHSSNFTESDEHESEDKIKEPEIVHAPRDGIDLSNAEEDEFDSFQGDNSSQNNVEFLKEEARKLAPEEEEFIHTEEVKGTTPIVDQVNSRGGNLKTMLDRSTDFKDESNAEEDEFYSFQGESFPEKNLEILEGRETKLAIQEDVFNIEEMKITSSGGFETNEGRHLEEPMDRNTNSKDEKTEEHDFGSFQGDASYQMKSMELSSQEKALHTEELNTTTPSFNEGIAEGSYTGVLDRLTELEHENNISTVHVNLKETFIQSAIDDDGYHTSPPISQPEISL